MDNDRLLNSTQSKYLSSALDCVKIRFVRNQDDLLTAKEFEPEFAHQHFDNEVIYGYQDLHLNINYTDASMFIFPQIKFKANIKQEDKSAIPDDIVVLLREQLPSEQLSAMVESKDQFFAHLDNQMKFKPFGNLIDKFTAGKKQFELFKMDESSPDFDSYLARIQTVAMWYIDAVDYTDNSDPRWIHYLLYESYPSPEGDGSRRYALAGYFSLYRFYHHPGGYRVRIAQAMLFPQFRRGGLGPRLLQSVYRDLINEQDVYDITAEDPADNFIFLRDYVDCLNCQSLPEFSAEKLRQGFSGEMQNAALNKFKLHSKQTRRVYEILRYASTDKANAEDLKSYRIDVKRRLEAPMKRDKGDWNKLCKKLDPEAAKALVAAESGEVKIQQLNNMYEDTILGYKQVITRLETYPEII